MLQFILHIKMMYSQSIDGDDEITTICHLMNTHYALGTI